MRHGVYTFVGATEAAVGPVAATITTLIIITGSPSSRPSS